MLELCDAHTACILFQMGDVAEARRRFEAHRRRLEHWAVDYTLYGHERGRKFWLVHAYTHLAMCAWYEGDFSSAEAHWRQAIALHEEMGEQRFCAFNLCHYALTCVTAGRSDEALELARRGLAYSQEFGDRIGVAYGQMTLGIVAVAQGQAAVAATYLQSSLAVGRQSGHRRLLVLSSVYSGRLALAQGALTDAQAHFEEALGAVTHNTALPYVDLAEVLIGRGLLALARGEHGPAADSFQQALQQAPRCAAWHVPEARLGLAKVHLAEGQLDRAYDILRQVVDNPVAAAATRAAARQLL